MLLAHRLEEQNAATSEISRNTTVTAEQTLAITEVAKSVSGTDQAARQVGESQA